MVIAIAGLLVFPQAGWGATQVVSDEPIYQQWVNEAKVPTPDLVVEVREAPCPFAETHGCVTYEPAPIVYLAGIFVRQAFFHELGHVYLRWRGLPNTEVSAEGYAFCAQFKRRPYKPFELGDDRLTRDQYRAMCRALATPSQ